MRILSAELIDGENISSKWASSLYELLDQEMHRSVSLVARVLVGNSPALDSWSGALHPLPFQTRTHPGGKDAADGLLKKEALQLAQQGISRFYVVSNDGDFASLAGLLRFQGCQVIGVGTYLAASRFQAACDFFLELGTDPGKAAAKFTALNQPQRAQSRAHASGDVMSLFGVSDPDAFASLPEHMQEAFKTLYGSAHQPPLLTNVLYLLLEHTMTALCLPDTDPDSDLPSSWSISEDAQTLTTGARDPVVSIILQQDATLRSYWQAVQALACRCSDAYDQGRKAAQGAFSHFPRHRVHALHQEKLAHLLVTWRYNPHAASPEAQHTYPGYAPEGEQGMLLRWFRRGYLVGSVEAEEAPSSRPQPWYIP